MILLNPFTSKIFTSVWCKHFNSKGETYTFSSLQGISFFKAKVPWYINVGKNLTKGMSYEVTEGTYEELKGKLCLIYDVPGYAGINTTDKLKNIKTKKIKQHPGFLIHLDRYADFNDYFKKTFSKSSVQKLNRYRRRLYTCFDIKEKMLQGASVKKSEYNEVFNHFHQLLTKRFKEKQITNNNLNPKEWRFYQDVAYPLLLENKAALHVIYNDDTPISVRLLYFSEAIIFDAITVFDTDYNKFHIGKLSIMKMLEWSFNSKYKIFDFSKGYFDYKQSWSDLKYDFEYHVLHDSKSMKASLLANIIALSFKTKQYLRDKNVNEIIHKISFILKQPSKNNPIIVKIVPPETEGFGTNNLQEIELSDDLDYLKKNIIDFQFLNSEHQKNIKLYQIPNQNRKLYLVKGEHNHQILTVSR